MVEYCISSALWQRLPLPKQSQKYIQGCRGQGNIYGKQNFFQVREKSGNFVDGQGNLERTWKVREKSGNSKINDYGRQSSENLLILFKRGKGCTLR